MDVDLLRPGTAPLSAETILWFEFLLDPTLLKKHLDKPNPEPTACELIIEFLSVDSKNAASKPNNEPIVDVDAPPPSPPQAPQSPGHFTRKQLALKILALKVAANLKWNLDIFENKLPPQIQQQMMQDLVYMSTDGAFAVPPQDIPQDLILRPEVQFAITLYYLWVIRFPVKAAFYAKTTKIPFMHIPGMQTETGYSPLNPHFEKILRFCEASRQQSIRFLDHILAHYEPTSTSGRRECRKIRVPVMDTFIHLTEDSDDVTHNWKAGDILISQYEFTMQIHYDLCSNYFFYAQHDLAKKHILGCRENSNLLERETSFYGYAAQKAVPWGDLHFANVTKDDIIGYIKALNLAYEVLNTEPSLLQKLQESVANHCKGIIGVLQMDNLSREIPFVHRQVVELDIQGSGLYTTDLLNRVSVLNAVRYTLDGGIPSTHADFISRIKAMGFWERGAEFFDMLLGAFAPVLTSPLSEKDWQNIRIFFLHLVTSEFEIPVMKLDEYFRKHMGEQADAIRKKLITDKELEMVLNCVKPGDDKDQSMEMPQELLSDDWNIPEFDTKSIMELELGKVKKRLIEASKADDVRMSLVQLAKAMPSSPLWKTSPSWKPAGNLGNAIVALPRGFLQDFGYIVSGAVRARAEAGCAVAANKLFLLFEEEARRQNSNDPAIFRLNRTLCWEVLIIQINLFLTEWPNHRLNLSVLVNKCKECIAANTIGDNFGPRPQAVEAAWIGLINATEWKGAEEISSSPGEIASALYTACLDLESGNYTRKFPRVLWDHVLSMSTVSTSGSTKRNASGQPHSRDNASPEMRSKFNFLLSTLRDPLPISVILSLLGALYNQLTDDSSAELTVEYAHLWPNSISNINNYSNRYVTEALTDVLERSLKLYPYKTSWLRIYSSLESCVGRWGAAVRRAAGAWAADTAYFEARHPLEGEAARRMVRALHSLAAPSHAAALCQLNDDTDYNTAFKCLAEKTQNACDSMDAYYTCVWDGTLLEVGVAQHARRGEGGRRARAVRAAGALELNSNNSDDIQREAAAVRRGRMLRALVNQYVG